MGVWIVAAALIAVVLVAIPLAALPGKGAGKRMGGNRQLAAILLGFGEVLDPPSRRRVEAGEPDQKDGPGPGAPPKPWR